VQFAAAIRDEYRAGLRPFLGFAGILIKLTA
jgi:hypothetical protein